MSVTSCHDSETCVFVPTDWGKCLFCQTDTKVQLQIPFNNLNSSVELPSYKSLADFLAECKGVFPIPIDIKRFDDGDGIENTLRKNCAKWHKSCRLKFYKKRLKRSQQLSADESEQGYKEDNVGPTVAKKVFTRSENPAIKGNCFFQCSSSDPSEVLHLAATREIDAKVRICAKELNDERVIAALSAGDMIAIDAKYHLKCLVTFYNRRRANQSDMKEQDKAEKAHESYAFAEIIAYMESMRSAANSNPVFKLSDLGTMYADILKCYGINSKVRNTDLKKRILSHFPSIEAFKGKKNILLIFKDDIGDALAHAFGIDYDEDAMHIAKAASIVRRDVLQSRSEFSGSLDKNDQTNAVPDSLAFLLSLIHKGPRCEAQKTDNEVIDQSLSSIGQLIVYNCNISKRHKTNREPPLPVYIGLSIHNLTRKKSIVNALHQLGLSISYNRVLEISTRIGISICDLYNADNVVCPPNLLKGVFVTGSADNIDHNPTSTTSTESFHGTVLQMNSHPSLARAGEKRAAVELFRGDITTTTVPTLPDFYTEIPPLMKLCENKTAPILTFVLPNTINNDQAERDWLEHLREVMNSSSSNIDMAVSWSSFHASRSAITYEPTTVSGMLPLFEEQAHTPAMIQHAMNIVKSAANLLNPGQTPVITLDQPLFAIAKKIQWNFPERFGEDKYVVMFGGLHVEMAILKMLGCWLDGSGWVEALAKASVAHMGTAESFIKVTHVTKTRRVHQVTAAALDILRHRAFEDAQEDNSLTNGITYEEWCSRQEETIPQFKYWSTVFKLQLHLLAFVRSIRNADFSMYKNTLMEIMPWCFALNRTNYSRWLTVHLRDMLALELTCRDVFVEFERGNFVVRKTSNPFSAMAIDQALEQTNALIKGDGGAVGILTNDSALRRWMVVGPEIARIIADFETSVPPEHKHHEQNSSFQRSFLNDVCHLLEVIEEFGNPFKETSGELLRLHNKEILPEAAVATLNTIETLGTDQFHSFIDKRLQSQNLLVSDVIQKNKLHLFSTPCKKKRSRQHLQVNSLRSDCALFSRFYIGCQTRNGDLNRFFQHENNPCPPSISRDGQIRSGKKSDIISCLLDSAVEPSEPQLQIETIILDGAAIVNMLQPGKQLKTFSDYAEQVFLPFIYSQLRRATRVDLIWDVYRSDSLKACTRIKRGQGLRRRVDKSNTLPRNWQEFLRVDENKRELFSLLGQFVLKIEASVGTVVVTQDENALCNSSTVSMDGIKPCNHEEADTRIILHVCDAFKLGREEVLVRTVDSDVVVLCVVVASLFIGKKLWLEFGVGKHIRIIAAHAIAETLGEDKCAALPFFHAFTGCDTCSSFSGKGKKSAWKVWTLLPELTATFKQLSLPTTHELDEDTFKKLEKYIIILYDRTSTSATVNTCRKEMFTQKRVGMEALPPTEDALRLHALRATLQGGLVWGSSNIPKQPVLDPSAWGWMKDSSGTWEPRWTTLSDAMNSCDEVISCKCKHDCKPDVCKCLKSGQPCCALCKCKGDCSL